MLHSLVDSAARLVQCWFSVFLMFYGDSEEKKVYLCAHNEVCKRSLRENDSAKIRLGRLFRVCVVRCEAIRMWLLYFGC